MILDLMTPVTVMTVVTYLRARVSSLSGHDYEFVA